MARLVLWPKNYKEADHTGFAPVAIIEGDWELKEAQWIAGIVLNANGVRLTSYSDSPTDGWDIPNQDGAWFERGSEKLIIPHISPRFRS